MAAMDRFDKRATPHMPWPLVQPDPIRAPKPTSRPATISVGMERSSPKEMTPTADQLAANPPMTRPIRKTARQSHSPARGNTTPAIMPLIPAILPLNNNRSPPPNPINTPPSREFITENSAMATS